jgi:hypothetical protein
MTVATRILVWLLLLVLAVIAVGWPAAEAGERGKVKKGRTIGLVTAKGANFIEVKADGEERGRKYVPRWVGGMPADGGGFDKAMLKTFLSLKIGSRVQVDWFFDERFRAAKILVLKMPEKK